MYTTLMPEFAVRPHYVLNVQVINFTPSWVWILYLDFIQVIIAITLTFGTPFYYICQQ